MKSLFTFILSFCVYVVSAQTTIYTQTFNGTYADWSLNTTDEGGVGVSASDNQWIVNNVYIGGSGLITVPATADEPSGITGYPESNYLHIYNPEDVIYGVPNNCNFLAGGTNSYFAALNTPIVTTGYTGVTFSFWWLCDGDASASGIVYYRTVSGGTWLVLPGGPASYYGSTAWANQTVTNSAFDNQAFLEFGFQFTEDLSGADPAFAVDEIKVTGVMSSTVAPVASFTSTPTPATICQDSCAIFTSTSTIASGVIDSIRWEAIVSGIPVLLSTANPFTFCAVPPYNVPGTYTMRLRVYGNAKVDSASETVTVNETPHPVIKKTGKVLSVAGAYSSFQWSNSLGKITGATSASYTYTVSGTSYTVTVDSGGCPATSSAIFTENVTTINSTESKYWFVQEGNSAIALHASDVLEEPLTITIYDATGRLILNEKWNAGSDSKEINDISPPPGLYIIRLNNNNTSSVLKWMR